MLHTSRKKSVHYDTDSYQLVIINLMLETKSGLTDLVLTAFLFGLVWFYNIFDTNWFYNIFDTNALTKSYHFYCIMLHTSRKKSVIMIQTLINW